MLENLRQRIGRALSARVLRPRGALQLRLESLESRSVLSAAGWSDVFAPQELIEPRLHFDRADTPAEFGAARGSLTFAAIGGLRGDVRMTEATSLSSKFTQFDERRLVSRDDAFGSFGDGSFAPLTKTSARTFDQPAMNTPSLLMSPWSTGWSVHTTVASNLATGTQVICCTIVSPSFADAAQGMSVVLVWANRLLPTSLSDISSQHADRPGINSRFGGVNVAPFSTTFKPAAASAVTLRADRSMEPARDAAPQGVFALGAPPSFDPPVVGHSQSPPAIQASDRTPPARLDSPRMIALGALGEAEYRHDLSGDNSTNTPTSIDVGKQSASAPLVNQLPSIDSSQGGMVLLTAPESFGGLTKSDLSANSAMSTMQHPEAPVVEAGKGLSLLRFLHDLESSTSEDVSSADRSSAEKAAAKQAYANEATSEDASTSSYRTFTDGDATTQTAEAANDPIIRQARASDALEGGMIALVTPEGAPADLPSMSEDAAAHREFVAAAAEDTDLESREIRMDASFGVFQAFEMAESDIDHSVIGHVDALETPVIISPVSLESDIDAAAAAMRPEENAPITTPSVSTAVLAGIGVAGGLVIAGRGRDRDRREAPRRRG